MQREIKFQWISVKDGLPDHGNRVLTYHPNSCPSIRIHCYSKSFYGWDRNTGGEITHWMNLPTEPYPCPERLNKIEDFK